MTDLQNKQLHVLLSNTGLMEHKQELVSSYTHGRSTHSRDLTDTEAWALIIYLRNLDTSAIQANKMRRKLLAMAHQLGWQLGGKIDMVRVDAWCVKYGFGHKPLNSYTHAELPRLLTIFEKMYEQQLKAI